MGGALRIAAVFMAMAIVGSGGCGQGDDETTGAEAPFRLRGATERQQLTRSQYQVAIQGVLLDSVRLMGVANELSYGDAHPRRQCVAMFDLVSRLGQRTLKQIKSLRPPADAAKAQSAVVRAGRRILAYAERARQQVGAGKVACGEHLARVLYAGWRRSKIDQAIAALERRGYVVFGE